MNKRTMIIFALLALMCTATIPTVSAIPHSIDSSEYIKWGMVGLENEHPEISMDDVTWTAVVTGKSPTYKYVEFNGVFGYDDTGSIYVYMRVYLTPLGTYVNGTVVWSVSYKGVEIIEYSFTDEVMPIMHVMIHFENWCPIWDGSQWVYQETYVVRDDGGYTHIYYLPWD